MDNFQFNDRRGRMNSPIGAANANMKTAVGSGTAAGEFVAPVPTALPKRARQNV